MRAFFLVPPVNEIEKHRGVFFTKAAASDFIYDQADGLHKGLDIITMETAEIISIECFRFFRGKTAHFQQSVDHCCTPVSSASW